MNAPTRPEVLAVEFELDGRRCEALAGACELRVVVAAGDRDLPGLHAGRQAAGNQALDLGLELGPRRRHGVITDHQRAHGRHGLDHAGNPGLADGRMQGHHPAVDFRGDLVAEFDGEGGVAAGQVPYAHIC